MNVKISGSFWKGAEVTRRAQARKGLLSYYHQQPEGVTPDPWTAALSGVHISAVWLVRSLIAMSRLM